MLSFVEPQFAGDVEGSDKRYGFALAQFLKDRCTTVYISLRLDNDKAGLAGMEKIRDIFLHYSI